ncbi:hypothetical protein GN956_G23891 [Arapaima gigas]
MWMDVKNQTELLQLHRSSSQNAVSQLMGASVPNGSTASPHPSQTAPPVDRGSGIIPGGIAAAVFISFLLALYAMLWKCMGSAPKRKDKKKKPKAHEQTELVC